MQMLRSAAVLFTLCGAAELSHASVLRIDVKKPASGSAAALPIPIAVKVQAVGDYDYVTITIAASGPIAHLWRTDFWRMQGTSTSIMVPIAEQTNVAGQREWQVTVARKELAQVRIVFRCGPAAPLAETMYMVHPHTWL